jgi:hypothetical protein
MTPSLCLTLSSPEEASSEIPIAAEEMIMQPQRVFVIGAYKFRTPRRETRSTYHLV